MGELNISPESLTLTSPTYQTCLIQEPIHPSLFKDRFRLRCFQPLSVYSVATQQCLVRQLVNQRLRSIVPLVLNGPSSQMNNTSNRCRQTVSRRSKPSSRIPLMGEQPHPWPLLHDQDGMSRQRSSKLRGRCVLLPATTQLSPG